jgi:hypothetical protein
MEVSVHTVSEKVENKLSGTRVVTIEGSLLDYAGNLTDKKVVLKVPVDATGRVQVYGKLKMAIDEDLPDFNDWK